MDAGTWSTDPILACPFGKQCPFWLSSHNTPNSLPGLTKQTGCVHTRCCAQINKAFSGPMGWPGSQDTEGVGWLPTTTWRHQSLGCPSAQHGRRVQWEGKDSLQRPHPSLCWESGQFLLSLVICRPQAMSWLGSFLNKNSKRDMMGSVCWISVLPFVWKLKAPYL